jgi:hypothetical protein
MLRKVIILVVLAAGLLLQTSPVPLRAFSLGSAGLVLAALPAGSVVVRSLAQADFNGDGSPESLLLSHARLTITSNGSPAWQSPSGWNVLQAEIADLNWDGKPEATLLVWRPFRPWLVDRWLPEGGRIDTFQDAGGNSCQIILIGWRGRAYGEVWAGSALAKPVRSFAVADLKGDNKQELVTLEGRYADPTSAPAHALKVWEWNGFGFSVVSAMEGNYTKMALVQTGAGPILILVP